MLLRESGRKKGQNYALSGVTSDQGEIDVAQGELLRSLADTAVAGDWQKLAKLRNLAEPTLGAQGLVDVLAIISGFYSITRIADATGIPLDEPTLDSTAELRERTGIDSFQYERKSQRYR